MSRKLLAFLLSELDTIRLICQRDACRAVTEVNFARMDSIGSSGVCPVCKHELYPGAGQFNNPLARLANAIQAVQVAQKSPDAAQVEFVLPDTSE